MQFRLEKGQLSPLAVSPHTCRTEQNLSVLKSLGKTNKTTSHTRQMKHSLSHKTFHYPQA